MSFSNQQTERNKLNNRKQTASPPPNSHIPHHGCAQKQSLDRRSGMPQRTVIKIKTKIPKRNQTSTHICPSRLSATKRGKASKPEKERERESYLICPSRLSATKRGKASKPERERERESAIFIQAS